MSWTQEYHVPNLIDLLYKLYGLSRRDIFREICQAHGDDIRGIQPIKVGGDDWQAPIVSAEVIFMDWRRYTPRKVREVTANGSYGRDEYEWFERGEAVPEVEHVDESGR